MSTKIVEWDASTGGGLDDAMRWRRPRTVLVSPRLFSRGVKAPQVLAAVAVMAIRPWHTFLIPHEHVEKWRSIMDRLVKGKGGPATKLGDALRSQFWDDDFCCSVENFINGWSGWRGKPDGNPCNGTVPRWPPANIHDDVNPPGCKCEHCGKAWLAANYGR